MGEVVHTARIRIVQKQRPLREAYIEGFAEPLRFGVHGGYRSFYRVQSAEPLPATIDHLLAALAG
ncbi:MAG: hypothetical protein K6U02_06120 [Firmicutes bacterium]|nr:hypothetical protein [Bacillota bacterium]